MLDERIARLNALAKLAKERELTKEELEERDGLRKEYIAAYRENLRAQLDNIVLVDEQGNKTKLQKKKKD